MDFSNLVVEANSICKAFVGPGSSVEVLHGCSVEVAKGEIVGVVGPSGSGKSTLIHCLAGLESVDEGSVRLFGNTDLEHTSSTRLAVLRRKEIGFVFQSLHLVEALTVRENVMLPLVLNSDTDAEHHCNCALKKVGLFEAADKFPKSLSGGEQQRVALARTLAQRPQLVFADEPTGALDQNTGNRVLKELRDLSAQGSSVVMVTHNLEAAAATDRVLVLIDGVIVDEVTQPSPETVFEATHDAHERRNVK